MNAFSVITRSRWLRSRSRSKMHARALSAVPVPGLLRLARPSKSNVHARALAVVSAPGTLGVTGRPGSKLYVYLRALAVAALCVAMLAGAPDAAAQSGQGFYNPRDDQFSLLGLRRAMELYDAARSEYERKRALYERQLISQEEWERATRSFTSSEVDYHQALLAVIFERQYVTIDGAVKYQDASGRPRVRLTLANASGGGGEYQKLIGIDDELFQRLQPDVVNDLYVSLLNEQGAIMSQPYEAKVERLQHGQPVTLDFALLQDLDAVTVNLIYGNGSQSSRKIFLEKDASANRVLVQSQQFAQEVELGGAATFDLTLELFSWDNHTFHLEVVNLPSQINRFFVDPATQARLSQFRFTEGTNTRRAALQVTMPRRPGADMPMDVPISFYVLVMTREQADAIGDFRNRQWSTDEIEPLQVGYVRLELVPRGIGEILVRSPQLHYQIYPDGFVEIRVELVNEGTRRLDDVQVTVDAPLNWTRQVEPAAIGSLHPGEERPVTVHLSPPPDVSAGRYDMRIRTTSYSDSQPISTPDKVATVEVRPSPNWIGTGLIMLFIVSVLGGIVTFGIRLSRR